MKTNNQTTYILLERGFEDVRLLKELRILIPLITKDIARKYPMVLELMNELKNEVKE